LSRSAFAERAAFIRAHTSIHVVPAVPGIRLLLADDSLAVWEATEADVAQGALDPPFWAFAWAGGLALARWLLDHPSAVAGRRVVDVATGSGLVAVAAAKAGAADVTACDLDSLAVVAAQLNAELNQVTLHPRHTAIEALTPDPGSLVVAGDVFYQEAMARTMLTALERHLAAGCDVLIGDPGRAYLPAERLDVLDRRDLEVDPEIEDSTVKPGIVARLLPRQ
jgi:predicted nicotinamide N-methyase